MTSSEPSRTSRSAPHKSKGPGDFNSQGARVWWGRGPAGSLAVDAADLSAAVDLAEQATTGSGPDEHRADGAGAMAALRSTRTLPPKGRRSSRRGRQAPLQQPIQPWREVLEWFAEQAELVAGADNPPPGTFNYQDARIHAGGGDRPAQPRAVDQRLHARSSRSHADAGRFAESDPARHDPPSLARRARQAGKVRAVKTLFKLQKMTPEEGQADVEKLLGPRAKPWCSRRHVNCPSPTLPID